MTARTYLLRTRPRHANIAILRTILAQDDDALFEYMLDQRYVGNNEDILTLRDVTGWTPLDFMRELIDFHRWSIENGDWHSNGIQACGCDPEYSCPGSSEEVQELVRWLDTKAGQSTQFTVPIEEPIPEGAQVMTVAEFVGGCKSNAYTSDDGVGYYSDGKIYWRHREADPWYVVTGSIDKEATHVVWFNR
jgi:hypothetical protein